MLSQKKLFALLLIMFHFSASSKVRTKVENNKSTVAAPSKNRKNVEEEVCGICNCTENLVDCSNRDLVDNLSELDWPNLSTIEVLDFRNNSITHVAAFPALTVEKIDLSHNKIKKIDNYAFKQLNKLMEINLGFNFLDYENLEPIVFGGKYRDNLPEPLTDLRILNLERNLLHTLNPDLFEHTPLLIELNLAGNPLEAFHHPSIVAVSELVKINKLNLSYCSLSQIELNAFHALRNLTTLDLSGNNFILLPEVLKDVKSLDVLIMSDNPIVSINENNSFPYVPLTQLIMSNMSQLKSIGQGGLSNLKLLEVLEIENCPQFETIDQDALLDMETNVSTHIGVTKLRLSNNKLRYLPSSLLGKWNVLKELKLQNNPWSCDCGNRELIQMILPRIGDRLMGADYENLLCSFPPEHQNKSLRRFQTWSLLCPDHNKTTQDDAYIFTGIVIGFPLGLALATLYLLRRRGYLFCNIKKTAPFSKALYKRAPPFEYDI